MVRIPAGCYTGKENTIAYINHDFLIDSTEVTEKSWFEIMEDSVVTSIKPKTKVSWYLAILYCNRKSILNGLDTCYTYNGLDYDSVLGRKTESVLKSFRTQMPYPFEVATGDVRMNGVIMTVDSNSKQAERIERVQISEVCEEEISYDSDDGRPEYFNGF